MSIKTTGRLLIIALAAVVAFLCLFLRRVPVEATYPVERVNAGLFRGLRTRTRALFRAQAVIRENECLKSELAALSLALEDAERQETENARLRRVLDYTAKAPQRWVAAEVLSRNGAAAGRGHTIRLDKGALAGIREGAVAVVPDGLVGRVRSVTPHTCEVALITDPAVQVSCEISIPHAPKTFGVLSGGDELLILRHLKNVTDFPPRSRVLTSGLGGIFPKGLEIGTLQTIRKDESGLAVEGEVLPSVDFASLEDVFVRREK